MVWQKSIERALQLVGRLCQGRRWLVGAPCATIPSWIPKPLMTLLARSSLLPIVAPVGLPVERWGRQIIGGPLSLLSVGNSGSASV